MLIGTHQRLRNQSLSISLDNNDIKQVYSSKYLGVIIDNHLSFEQHVNNLTSRARSKLLAIRRLMSLPRDVFLLHTAFVLPAIDYCDVAWSPNTKKFTAKIEKIQKLAARIALRADTTARTVDLYKKLNWSTLEQRRRYHTAKYVYKVLHKLTPPYLHNTFELSQAKTGRLLRNNFRVFVPQIKTCLARKSFYYRGTEIWNSLPYSLYESPTLELFKRRYIEYYL